MIFIGPEALGAAMETLSFDYRHARARAQAARPLPSPVVAGGSGLSLLALDPIVGYKTKVLDKAVSAKTATSVVLSMTNRVTETSTKELYERFPHLRRIDEIWGTSACRKFIFQLMTDTRSGTRQGFPNEHAVTIMSLLMEHDRRFPQFENEIGHHDTRWGDIVRRGTRDL